MPEHWDPLINRIRDLLDPPRGGSDAELLQQFIAHRDEAAFATLIERHGPMVLGVCRRILHGSAEADDAFQVTFLTLAVRARSLRNQQALASWLYRVAYFVALRARRQAERRRQQEVKGMVAVQVDPAQAVANEELADVLDEELNKLPEKYRAPLVLCALEGKTSEEAARALGWPAGSMSRRLSKARDLLRQRLTRLGFSVPAAGGAALLGSQAATAAVPAALAERTLQHSMLLLAGQSVEPGTLGANVASLLQESLRSALPTKLRWAAVLVVLVLVGAAASFGIGALPPEADELSAHDDAQAEPVKPQAPADPLPDGASVRLGSLDWRHGGDVKLAGFVDTGKQVLTVTGSEGHNNGRHFGLCRLWDPGTRREISRLALKDEVSQACLSADGRRLAVLGHNRGEIFIYDVAARKLLCTIPPTPKGNIFRGFTGLRLAPAGDRLATISADQVVRVWVPDSGKLLHKLGKANDTPGISWPMSLAFTPDGKVVAFSNQELVAQGWQSSIACWDVASGKALNRFEETVPGPGDLVYLEGIVFAPDGQHFVRPRRDGTLALCAADTGKEIRRLGQPPRAKRQQPIHLAQVVFAPDGKTLAVRDHDYGLRLRLIEVATGKELRHLGDNQATNRLDPNDSLAFAPDGRRLMAVTGNTLRQWAVPEGKELTSSSGHHARLDYLAVSADGKTLVTYAGDQRIIVWDLLTGQEKQRHDLPYFIRNLAVSPDGRLLAFGGPKEVIHVLDTATGKERHALTTTGQAQEHTRGGEGGLVFSPDGTLLASKDSGLLGKAKTAQVRLWNMATGKELRHFHDPFAHIGSRDLQFTADGRLLAVISLRPYEKDKQKYHYGIRFWDVASGCFVREIQPGGQHIYSYALSPDGRTVAFSNYGNKGIGLWEVATGTERCRLEGAEAINLAFTPDGKMLVATDVNRQLCFWDLRTGKLLGRQASPVYMGSIAFLPDGRLASANYDTTVLLWDVARFTAKLTKPEGHLDQPGLEKWWQELLDRDAKVATIAQARLRAAPADALAFLTKKLAPAQPMDGGRIDKLIAGLDDDDFTVRRQSYEELADLGMVIVPRLRRELANSPSLETTNRLRELLDLLPRRPLTPETLREIRAVEVLEAMQARPLLDKLAKGAAEARLTQETRSALERLPR